MSRILLLTGLAILGLLSAGWAGDERGKPVERKGPTAQEPGRRPQEPRGRDGDAAKELGQGVLLVVSKEHITASLKNVSLRSLGGRSFLVGTEVPSSVTKASFAGKTMWIPLSDITQLIEMDEAKAR